jgi:hypothetical protein
MKIRPAFVYSSMSGIFAINALVSLGACVNGQGWAWYASLLISVFAFSLAVQMWNYTADQK